MATHRGALAMIALLLTAGGLSVQAAQSVRPRSTDAPMMVYGAGRLSCGAWSASRKQPEGSDIRRHQFESWVAGFVTAYNWRGQEPGANGVRDVLASTDMDGAFGFIDKYCADDPLKTMLSAVIALVAQLDGEKRVGR